MKNIRIVIATCLLVSCGHSEKHGEEQFAGTFVRLMKDSTGSLEDTFHISRIGKPDAVMYTIVRNMGIVNVDDSGRALPKEYKEVKWSARYKQAENCLEIDDTGERYVVLENNTGITNGKISYKKID